jgi:hypothetical protein
VFPGAVLVVAGAERVVGVIGWQLEAGDLV